MCRPTWPIKIGRSAFAEYAVKRGWTDDEVKKAWDWMSLRQKEMDLEAQKVSLARQRGEVNPFAHASPVSRCSCDSCQADLVR